MFKIRAFPTIQNSVQLQKQNIETHIIKPIDLLLSSGSKIKFRKWTLSNCQQPDNQNISTLHIQSCLVIGTQEYGTFNLSYY